MCECKCEICNDMRFITSLDGELKRCPQCNPARSVRVVATKTTTVTLRLSDIAAAIHALRLGGDDADSQGTYDEHIEHDTVDAAEPGRISETDDAPDVYPTTHPAICQRADRPAVHGRGWLRLKQPRHARHQLVGDAW